MIIILALLLSRRGYVITASLIFISATWLGLSYVAWIADGIRDIAFFGYIIPIMMAGLLLGWQGALGFTAVSILSGWALAYAQAAQLLVPTLDTPLHFARDMTAVFALSGLIIYLTISNLQRALGRSRTTAQELSTSNQELNQLRVDLEQRVEARTSELVKRAAQLEAVSSVARTIASVQDIDTLLPAITRLVSQQFGFYHVGIFLLDVANENAVLRASNSDGGQRMLSRQHSLPMNSNSIVGYATSRGEPRIALDVGAEVQFLQQPRPSGDTLRVGTTPPRCGTSDRRPGCAKYGNQRVHGGRYSCAGNFGRPGRDRHSKCTIVQPGQRGFARLKDNLRKILTTGVEQFYTSGKAYRFHVRWKECCAP